jgi:hypothetical protein
MSFIKDKNKSEQINENGSLILWELDTALAHMVYFSFTYRFLENFRRLFRSVVFKLREFRYWRKYRLSTNCLLLHFVQHWKNIRFICVFIRDYFTLILEWLLDRHMLVVSHASTHARCIDTLDVLARIHSHGPRTYCLRLHFLMCTTAILIDIFFIRIFSLKFFFKSNFLTVKNCCFNTHIFNSI